MTATQHATQLPTCPPWCIEEHTDLDRTHWGELHAVPSADAGSLLIGAQLRQDPDGAAVISLDVQPEADTLTPEGTRAYAELLLELVDQDRPALGATVRLSDRVNVGAPFRSGPVVGYGTVHPDHFPVPVDQLPAYSVVLVAGPDGSAAAWSLDRLELATSERTS